MLFSSHIRGWLSLAGGLPLTRLGGCEMNARRGGGKAEIMKMDQTLSWVKLQWESVGSLHWKSRVVGLKSYWSPGTQGS